MSKPGSFFANSIVTCFLIVLLLATVVAFIAPTKMYGQELAQPKLIWERAFDRGILAVGVDKDCYDPAKKNIAACLKWILLRGMELRLFDQNGELMPEPLRGEAYPECVSANGKYFILVQAEGEWWNKGIDYVLLDWSGNKIWETHHGTYLFPLVRNDGSAVFPLYSTMNDAGTGAVWGLKSFDARGRLTNRYLFADERYLWGRGLGVSDSFFAMAIIPSREGLEVCVFDKNGQLVWKRDKIKGRAVAPQGKVRYYSYGGLTVSDRGEVFLLLDTSESYDSRAFIYGGKGVLRDTLMLYPTGTLYPLKTYGRFAFITTGRIVGKEPSHLLCYDFENMRVNFVLEAEDGRSFRSFDVDTKAGLVAVAAHRRGDRHVVKVYDLDGHYKTEVEIKIGSGYRTRLWLKLLGSALLVAEKNKLGLYSINGG